MHNSYNSNTAHTAMATTKKTRRLLKKEVMFIPHRLQELDLDIMEAFIVKEGWKQWNCT